MIYTMEQLYRATDAPTKLRLEFTEQKIPYLLGTCPNCKQETLCIFQDKINAHCINPQCRASFTMFSFCKDVLGFEGQEIVKFITGKTDDLNEFDYRDFAKIVYPHIFREEAGVSKIVYDLPEDREPVDACYVCGNSYFAYRVTQTTVTPYCLYCGQYLPVPKKTKNLKKRGNRSAAWSNAVRRRYGGKCALCGSTDNCEAHHVVPYSICPEHQTNVDNGILLCHKHHMMAHVQVLNYDLKKKR